MRVVLQSSAGLGAYEGCLNDNECARMPLGVMTVRCFSTVFMLCCVMSVGGCFSALNNLDEAAPAKLSTGDRVTVVAVTKGDEVEVSSKNRRATVRLVGIMSFGDELAATNLARLRDEGQKALSDKINGKTLTIELEAAPRDDRGRYLGTLKLGDVNINEWTLQEGWAIAYTEFPFSRESQYLEAERKARKARKGLWSRPKTLELAKGLRMQWHKFREERSAQHTLNDPLLLSP